MFFRLPEKNRGEPRNSDVRRPDRWIPPTRRGVGSFLDILTGVVHVLPFALTLARAVVSTRPPKVVAGPARPRGPGGPGGSRLHPLHRPRRRPLGRSRQLAGEHAAGAERRG